MRVRVAGLWVDRRLAALLPGVVRRALAGAEPQPRWLPQRVVTVASADVDTGAGAGAVWFVWRPRSARARDHTALLEWYEERWRCPGGSISPADDPADGEVLDVRGGGGTRSLVRASDPPESYLTAPWIRCVHLHVGRDVAHVLIGGRRIEVAGRRRLIAAWKAPATSRTQRPLIVALGHDGTELSRIGPRDGLDSGTWQQVRDAIGEDEA